MFFVDTEEFLEEHGPSWVVLCQALYQSMWEDAWSMTLALLVGILFEESSSHICVVGLNI